MKQKLIIIWIIGMLTAMIFMPLASEQATGEQQIFIFYSEYALDGTLNTEESTYLRSYAPLATDYITMDTIADWIVVGQNQTFTPPFTFTYKVWQGHISFNTSSIPETQRVTSCELHMAPGTPFSEPSIDFDIAIHSIDYGNALDGNGQASSSDWYEAGIFEGYLMNTTEGAGWKSMFVSASSVNTSGRTQFKLNSSRTMSHTNPILTASETCAFFAGGSMNVPYLTIQTITETEAILTYNFTQNNPIPEIMNITYSQPHNDLAHLHEEWENGSFIHNNWTTTGTPFIADWATPYEGTYHAGCMVNVSGTGLHALEIHRPTNQHQWINVDYARKTTDAGQGTPTLRVDWWDGYNWYNIELISGTNAYARNSANLSLLGADNNPFFTLRFQMDFPTPQNAGNAVWIGDIWINASEIADGCDCDTFIHPAEIQDYNTTHELLRYEVFIDDIYEWINITINASLVYSTHIPHLTMTSETTDGLYYYNITENLFLFQDTFMHIWFFKAKQSATNYTEQMNIYPVEIIDWGAQSLVRYEFESLNATQLTFEAPNTTFTYLSISPQATVTQNNATTWTFTDLHEYTHYKIWFTYNKTTYCNAFISLYRESNNEGIAFGTWDCFINNGSVTNDSIMETVNHPEITLDIGTTYTISIYDYFPTANFITNYTFIAINSSMDVNVPVPYGPLNFYSFRNDFTGFRIWFGNTSGDPFTDHIPPTEWYQMLIRGGNYTIAIDYLTTLNGSETIDATYFINVTINSSVAYSIKIGVDQIEVLQTTVNGQQITLTNILTTVDHVDVNWVFEDGIYATGGTKSTGGFFVLDPEPYLIVQGSTIYSDWNATGDVTLWAGELDESSMYGHWTYESDELWVAAANSSATMLINDTTLVTTLQNTSAPPGNFYDIYINNYSSRGNNLTVWVSEGAFSVYREISFVWAREISWTRNSSDNYYWAVVTVNNSLPATIRHPEFLISYPEIEGGVGIDKETVNIFNNDDQILLSRFSNYTVYDSGVGFERPTIHPSWVAEYTVSFFLLNHTDDEKVYIEPSDVNGDGIVGPDWFNEGAKLYRMVEGEYTSTYFGTFTGQIIFQLSFPEANEIDPTTLKVIDIDTGMELNWGSQYHFTGSSIELFQSYTGEMQTGETIKIRVLYLTAETIGYSAVTAETPMGAPLYVTVIVILIIAGLFSAFLAMSGKKERKALGKLMLGAVIGIGIIAIFIMFIYSLVGG